MRRRERGQAGRRLGLGVGGVLGRGVPGAVGSTRGLWKRSREGEVSGGPARESVAGVGERDRLRRFFFPSPEEGEGRF